MFGYKNNIRNEFKPLYNAINFKNKWINGLKQNYKNEEMIQIESCLRGEMSLNENCIK
jgi:hypothetical protein